MLPPFFSIRTIRAPHCSLFILRSRLGLFLVLLTPVSAICVFVIRDSRCAIPIAEVNRNARVHMDIIWILAYLRAVHMDSCKSQ
ncbi:hypothetical protein F5Y13DRAFT_157943 [Hypoxylon sp. FL1857]|nr:hypothetical protein F5Y13DRAFT_157943 [Hypoxylon sp. FL1857]